VTARPRGSFQNCAGGLSPPRLQRYRASTPDPFRTRRGANACPESSKPDLTRILNADRPLTLASVARGAQPLVMADLARAAKGRAVFRRARRAGDARGDRLPRAGSRPKLQVIEIPRVGLPALRPRRARRCR
jgi:hypothetical protein